MRISLPAIFCGPCPPSPPPGRGATCYGACANLLEDDCLATPGCHAAYHTPGDALGEPPPPMFDSCWDIMPLTVAEAGVCAGLDALTCSRHDDCVCIPQPACACGSAVAGCE